MSKISIKDFEAGNSLVMDNFKISLPIFVETYDNNFVCNVKYSNFKILIVILYKDMKEFVLSSLGISKLSELSRFQV